MKLVPRYLAGSAGCIFVFDCKELFHQISNSNELSVTNRVSFEHVEDWVQEVEKYNPTLKVLVGNKTDGGGRPREVSEEEAEELAERLGMDYFETSAVHGEFVSAVFQVSNASTISCDVFYFTLMQPFLEISLQNVYLKSIACTLTMPLFLFFRALSFLFSQDMLSLVVETIPSPPGPEMLLKKGTQLYTHPHSTSCVARTVYTPRCTPQYSLLLSHALLSAGIKLGRYMLTSKKFRQSLFTNAGAVSSNDPNDWL